MPGTTGPPSSVGPGSSSTPGTRRRTWRARPTSSACRGFVLTSILVSLRPRQWVKNLFVFAGLVFAQKLFTPSVWPALGAFAVFCTLSGSVYLVNDAADREKDRLHPDKKWRPIASGRLPAGTAVTAAAVLVVAALAGSLALSRPLAVVALDVGISGWLLICTVLMALFLALGKRRHEYLTLGEAAVRHRPILAEYSAGLLDQMIAVVTASTVTAYALYTMSPETVAKFETHLLPVTLPFVLYGIFRYLYLLYRRQLGGNPSELFLNDGPLLVNTLLWILAVALIIYGPRVHPPGLG